MVLKIKTFGFQKNYTRYERNVGDKTVHLKKIYEFASDHFLIRSNFRLNRRKRYQKFKNPFCTKSMRDTQKMLNNIVRF